MLSGSAVTKSVTPAIHYAALVRLRDIIRESFIAETHPDYKKINGNRSPKNGYNPLVLIDVLYGCASYGDIPYRVKTTLKRYLEHKDATKAYSYEITNVEILKGTVAPVARPNNKTSTLSVNILLQGVRDVNGELLIK